MQFATEIDRPLIVSSIFGIVSGIMLLSSLGAISLKLGLVDYGALITVSSGYSSALTFSSLIISTMIDGLFLILGSVVILFVRMNIERKGVLGLFVFLGSVLAVAGSLLFFGLFLL